MIIDMKYWTKVIKRILNFMLIIIGLCLLLKLSIFYMPFLIAFIIYLLIEPAIKFLMRKLKLTRRMSAIIIFIVVSVILISTVIWTLVSLFSEASTLLESLGLYIDKAYETSQNLIGKFDFDKIHLPDKILNVINGSTGEILDNVSNWIRNFLMKLLNIITSLPSIGVYTVVTITALYLISVDKIYILDQIEHHLPQKWVQKLGNHIRDLIKTLGEYLKAEATLIFISFIISLVGLYILKIIKLNIEYPLLMALFIGFVDAMPILGSGTVMVPWAILSGMNGDIKLGVAILVLLVIMSVVRQFLEPKLISKHIGTHPIFTLIAMYTGFKFIGVLGLILGPVALIVIKNVFGNLIDDGIMKSLFDKV